ncbi:DUF3822 family protein [bacterium]|nr:DUF3822 family protein [bacterium]
MEKIIHHLSKANLSPEIATQCNRYVVRSRLHEVQAIYHKSSQQFIALFAILAQNNGSSTNKSPWPNLDFANNYFLSRPEYFSFVPHLFYSADKLPEYLVSTTNQKVQGNAVSDEVPLLNLHMVYPETSRSTSGSIYSHLLQQIAAQLCTEYPHFVYFHIEAESLLVFAFEDGQLQMGNKYRFKSKEDILFYILATANDFVHDINKVPFFYSGYLRPKTQLKNLLATYIPHLQPVPLESQVGFDVCINPEHRIYYRDVFILPICAL